MYSCTSSKCRLYIFWSFGIIGLIPSQFENRVPLKLVLGGVGSGAPLHYCTGTLYNTESAIFIFFGVFLASRGSSFRIY